MVNNKYEGILSGDGEREESLSLDRYKGMRREMERVEHEVEVIASKKWIAVMASVVGLVVVGVGVMYALSSGDDTAREVEKSAGGQVVGDDSEYHFDVDRGGESDDGDATAAGDVAEESDATAGGNVSSGTRIIYNSGGQSGEGEGDNGGGDAGGDDVENGGEGGEENGGGEEGETSDNDCGISNKLKTVCRMED
jgi:hypothetical protein